MAAEPVSVTLEEHWTTCKCNLKFQNDFYYMTLKLVANHQPPFEALAFEQEDEVSRSREMNS